MRNYLEWMDSQGFIVADYWDIERGVWGTDGKLQLFPFQRAICDYCFTLQPDGRWRFNRILYSTLMKSGKTALAASFAAWALEEFPAGSEIFICANDAEQGIGNMGKALMYHAMRRGHYVTNSRVEAANGSFVQVLAQHAASAAGNARVMVLFDELWGYRCLRPSHRVLTADLRWVAAGSLRPGDELVAFDEERGDHAYRAWRSARVLSARIEKLPAVHIHAGSQRLVCTPDHRWLARRKLDRNNVVWVQAQDLQPGDQLMRVLPVWDEDRSWDAAYLAAAFDGEGHLSVNSESLGYSMRYTQRENEMSDQVLKSLRLLGFDPIQCRNDSRNGKRPCYTYNVGNKREVMRLLGTIRPKRLLPKFDPDKLGRMTADEWVTVDGVYKGYDEPMVMLGTTSKTFVAEGFASHNTEGARRMYSEMTPIPTKPLSLQIITTYAGYEHESDLLWDTYLLGVGPEEHNEGQGQAITLPGAEDAPTYVNGRRFTYWNHEPTMPWQTDDYYDDQRKDLRPADYLRFHENRWVTSHESFLDPAWWDEAAKAFPLGSALLWGDHPYKGYPLYLGVDVGTKHDRTSAVAVAYDAKLGRVAQVAHRIWTPVEGELFDLEGTVELWLRVMHKRFLIRQIGYDPNQFHRSMVTLTAAGLPMVEFVQSPSNMAAASQQLYELLRGKKFSTYPDDEAREHLRNAVAKDTGRGFRIVKDPVIKNDKKRRNSKPVDFAVALAMACYLAVESGGVDVSQPVVWPSPFGDVSAWPATLDDQEKRLPLPLRSNY